MWRKKQHSLKWQKRFECHAQELRMLRWRRGFQSTLPQKLASRSRPSQGLPQDVFPNRLQASRLRWHITVIVFVFESDLYKSARPYQDALEISKGASVVKAQLAEGYLVDWICIRWQHSAVIVCLEVDFVTRPQFELDKFNIFQISKFQV